MPTNTTNTNAAAPQPEPYATLAELQGDVLDVMADFAALAGPILQARSLDDLVSLENKMRAEHGLPLMTRVTSGDGR